jgi:hypothetical protein
MFPTNPSQSLEEILSRLHHHLLDALSNPRQLERSGLLSTGQTTDSLEARKRLISEDNSSSPSFNVFSDAFSNAHAHSLVAWDFVASENRCDPFVLYVSHDVRSGLEFNGPRTIAIDDQPGITAVRHEKLKWVVGAFFQLA